MKSLHVMLICLGLVLSACGDADSDSPTPMGPGNNPNGQTNLNNANNEEPSNSLSNSSENNSNSTNNATNNTNAAENNSGTNNSSNNATNNQTAVDPKGTLSCMDILGCLLGCHADDDVCEAECRELGNAEAKLEIDAFLGCVDFHCAEAMTVTALTECTLGKCSEEQNVCLGTR